MSTASLRLVLVLTLSLSLGLFVGQPPPADAAPAAQSSIVITIDNPAPGEQNMNPGWIAGWAVDMAAASGTGIDMVAVYLDGDQSTGTFLGLTNYGGDRADVAMSLGRENFRYSGFTMPLTGMDIAPGNHSFTVVAHSTLSQDYAAKMIGGVSLAPSGGSPPAPPAVTSTSSNTSRSPIQLSATLSNVSFLAGQNLYNSLPNYNGYVYPGFTLPNGTTIANGTVLNNGMLTYNGSLVPVSTYATPATTVPSVAAGTSYTYRTVLPSGVVIPANATTSYFYNGQAFTGLQPGASLSPTAFSSYQGQNDVVLYQPLGNGYMATVPLPGSNYWGNNFSYSNYNLNGNAGVQATLVARVTYADGTPVQGAKVTYQGYTLPMTDSNGITTGTIMFPVTAGNQLSGTVHAEFNGMSADVPVVLSYNLP